MIINLPGSKYVSVLGFKPVTKFMFLPGLSSENYLVKKTVFERD